eukprot:TRINITY_DN454_c1_g1_i1.p1 TRINITY_DN454_c1_g1~~TRINITY_DN454_c1_g1_i1.p1  ORF type:complete len:547 (+),score=114.30 TRINITY_DN454_c1_g1_i1:45-1685(+)
MHVLVSMVAFAALQWNETQGSTAGNVTEFSGHASGWDAANGRFITYLDGVTYEGRGQPNVVWTVLEVSGPPGRHSMVYASDSQGLVIATGEGPGKVFYSDVWRFSYTTSLWAQLSDDTKAHPEARYGAVGGIYTTGSTSVLQITHGFSAIRYGDTWDFDLTTNEWTRVHDEDSEYSLDTPHPRCLASGVTNAAGNLFMFGGCLSGGETGGPCPSHDSWCYSNSQGWRQVTSGRPTPRVRGGMAGHPTDSSKAFMLTSGDVKIGNQWLEGSAAAGNQVAVMDCNEMRWDFYTPEGAGPPSLNDAAVLYTNTAAYVVGGKGGGLGIWTLTWDATVEQGTPGSGGVGGYITLPILHGVFMFLAWGVCCNFGVLIGRYWKAGDPKWFQAHRALMSIGLLLAIIGFGLIIPSVQSKHFMFAHGGIGLAVMIVGLLQPLNAFVRPHKAPASTLRTVWELVHKNAGRLALLLANINIILGMLLLIAPLAAFAVGVVYIGFVFFAFVGLELYMRVKYGFTEDWQATILASLTPNAPDSTSIKVGSTGDADENKA